MATYAAASLAKPGTVHDRAWVLNATAHIQLKSLGKFVAVPLAVLGVALFATGVGWLRRRYWGWVMGVCLIGMNLIGDLINTALGEVLKGTIGVVIAGVLLAYLIRPGVRNYFRAQQLSS